MIPRLAKARAAVLAALSLSLPACYRGEWRLGQPVPISSQSRLQATRDVEQWELEPTVTPYVVRVRAGLVPRCRNALYGTTRRTDTGTFVKTGAGYWRAAALATGVLGGASALTGGAGWIARDGGAYAGPAMYAVGGLLGVGGLINCILSIQKGSPVRYALCGSLLGAGAAISLGAGLSSINVNRTVTDPMTMMPVTQAQPLIGTDVWKGMVYGGAAGVGVAAFSGVASAVWRGQTERTRVIEEQGTSVWDRQQGEAVCGPARPLIGRTATLEIAAERIPDGPGSEGEPLKLRVAIGDEGQVAVDLRPLRQALPDCGVLRVQLNPDTLYERYVEDYVPPGLPASGGAAGRPIHGQILPAEGLTLQGLEGRHRPAPGRLGVPGFAEDLIGAVERRCKAEVARAPRVPPPAPAPEVVHAPLIGPPAPGGTMPLPGIDEPDTTPPAPAPPPRADSGECSPERRQDVVRECELSCSKSLEISTCLFDRRKCMIEARYSQQRQRDQELCDLSWERCIFKSGIGPGSWDRCVDGCRKKNELSLCPPSGEGAP